MMELHSSSGTWVSVDALSETQQQVFAILQRHGQHATSFQVMETGYEYWIAEIEGEHVAVAYVLCSSYRVVAGPPIAPLSSLAVTTKAFLQDCELSGHRALFVSVEDSFVQALHEAEIGMFDVLPIGEQPEWNPVLYETDTRKHRTLRSQVRRAQRKGVAIHVVTPEEILADHGPLASEISWVVEQWKAARTISPMQFMVDLQPFHLPSQRRYFIAEQDRRAVGVLIAIPVYERGGWFFEDILRVPGAPNGTVELLIDTAFRTIKEEGSLYATLGLSPLSHVEEEPQSHPWLHRVFRFSYRHLGGLYQFAGLRSFKQRFVPDQWTMQYIVAVGHRLSVRDLHIVLRALLGDGLFAFGWDSARRWVAHIPYQRWSQGLYWLASLLIPWTLLLALADGQRWFGSISTQYAWVAFDTALVLALGGLGRLTAKRKNIAHTFAIFLAGATSTDLVLTTVQTFYLHQNVTGWASLFVIAGMLGPLFATIFLVILGMNRPTN